MTFRFIKPIITFMCCVILLTGCEKNPLQSTIEDVGAAISSMEDAASNSLSSAFGTSEAKEFDTSEYFEVVQEYQYDDNLYHHYGFLVKGKKDCTIRLTTNMLDDSGEIIATAYGITALAEDRYGYLSYENYLDSPDFSKCEFVYEDLSHHAPEDRWDVVSIEDYSIENNTLTIVLKQVKDYDGTRNINSHEVVLYDGDIIVGIEDLQYSQHDANFSGAGSIVTYVLTYDRPFDNILLLN